MEVLEDWGLEEAPGVVTKPEMGQGLGVGYLGGQQCGAFPPHSAKAYWKYLLSSFFYYFFFCFEGIQGERRGEESLSVPWFPHLCIQGLYRPHTGSLRG